jgi:undecaprenyl-diphosphatase
MILRTALVALLAAAAYVWLGLTVSHAPPGALDLAGRALAGQAPQVALVFTISCWWYVLLALGACAALLALFRPEWRGCAIFSIAVTLVAWQASDLLKNVFARPRPDYWLLHQETSYAYSSGHAMFAIVVFGLWSYYFATSTLPGPLRAVLSVACAAWGAAVIWSRLALGAHYVTDLIGGVLLGIAMLAIGEIVAAAWPRPRPAPTTARP